jgi:SH3-like domain-containing protein
LFYMDLTMIRVRRRALFAAFVIGVVGAPLGLAGDGVAQSHNNDRSGTGLPVPRFVSLKSDSVNVRRGPGQDYDIAFTFVRAGLPVEITEEFGNWRKIRDSEGSEGWVFHSLLSGRRTAIVAPWQAAGQFPAHRSAETSAVVVAYLEPRVMADVEQCTGTWCLLSGPSFEGWIEQERLWGVYPNEQIDE